jgi:hypothetical protein
MGIQTGAIEIALEPGGDFQLQPNGDLVLAIDAPGNPIATQQRLYRLLTTNPRAYNSAGQPISAPDDIFNPSYGAGLPALVGQPITTALLAQIEATILNALLNDPSVASNPAPQVTVSQSGTNEIVVGPIVVTAVSGQVYTIPSFTLSASAVS